MADNVNNISSDNRLRVFDVISCNVARVLKFNCLVRACMKTLINAVIPTIMEPYTLVSLLIMGNSASIINTSKPLNKANNTDGRNKHQLCTARKF